MAVSRRCRAWVGSFLVLAAASMAQEASADPTFGKSFSPASIRMGERTQLTLEIDNTAGLTHVYSIAFTDDFPTGLAIAQPSNLTTDCAGTIAGEAGTTRVSLTGGSLPTGSSCSIVVDVRASGAGTLANTTSELTWFDGSLGTTPAASASLTVSTDPVHLIKHFVDNPVPPGGETTLRFSLTNYDRNYAAENITFTDDLDATLSGLAATGLPLQDVCGSGSTLHDSGVLTLTGGYLGAGESCSFDVTLAVPAGAAPGEYTNTTSTVAADVGGSPLTAGAASDTLFVQPVPRLELQFLDLGLSPDPVVTAGEEFVAEYTITNTSATEAASSLEFSHGLADLVPGITLVSLPASGFCLGTGSISYISSTLSVSGASLAAGASCSFEVTFSLPADAPTGEWTSSTSPITGTVGGVALTGNAASDSLTVVTAPTLQKAFDVESAQAGDQVTLTFELSNSENAPAAATGIAFTDDLEAMLTGVVAVDLPKNDVCGPGSQIAGTSVLTFQAGTLAAGESCSFQVTVQLPVGAAPGIYTNQTSLVTATVDGKAVQAPAAADDLQVAALVMGKSFTTAAVVPGGVTTVQFAIDNLSVGAAATDITFADDLSGVLGGLTALDLPVSDICGAGSQLFFSSPALTLAGGTLAAGESCSFSVDLQVPAGAAEGSYSYTTAASAQLDGSPVSVPPATAAFSVEVPLTLTKSFTDDPVPPGGTVNLRFVVSNTSSTLSASAIGFSDDLDGALSGLVAVGLPANDVCGSGSTLSGSSVVTLADGLLGPGEQCTFDVSVQLPAGVPLGSRVTNTTSVLSATIGGTAVTTAPASDDLLVESAQLQVAFTGDAFAGGGTQLQFTLDNRDTVGGLSDLSMAADLDAALAGLTASGLPLADACGPGSSVSGTGTVVLQGASLDAGGSCSFSVPVEVPGDAPAGSYALATSEVTSAGLRVGAPAGASLAIQPAPGFSGSFSPTVLGEGGSSTLRYTVDNTASTLAAGSLDFDVALPTGLALADPPNAVATCTGGSLDAVAGGSAFGYSGGSAAAGGSCTVEVAVHGVSAGSYTVTSGALTSEAGDSGTASASLTVNPAPVFTKSFAPADVAIGDTSTLTLTIDNGAGLDPATDLAFVDTLPAGTAIAVTPNAATTCTGGTLTALSEGASVVYSGGSVAAGATCTVTVDVTATAAGSHTNTSGHLTSSFGDSGEAVAELHVAGPPPFAKAFAPDRVAVAEASTLTFTIDNGGNTLGATGLAFTDPLPDGVTVADPPNASTTCTGGTVTALAGESSIGYSGGSVAAGATCTVQADVVGTQPGLYDNTSGALASSLGSSEPATAQLTVTSQANLTLTVSPEQVPAREPFTLIFTLTNPSGDVPASNVEFQLNLPAGFTVSQLPAQARMAPQATSDGCGGSVSAPVGGNSIGYSGGTVSAGGSCSVSVDVVAAASGDYDVTAWDLQSNLNAESVTTPDLTVFPAGIPLLLGWPLALLALLMLSLGMRRQSRLR